VILKERLRRMTFLDFASGGDIFGKMMQHKVQATLQAAV